MSEFQANYLQLKQDASNLSKYGNDISSICNELSSIKQLKGMSWNNSSALLKSLRTQIGEIQNELKAVRSLSSSLGNIGNKYSSVESGISSHANVEKTSLIRNNSLSAFTSAIAAVLSKPPMTDTGMGGWRHVSFGKIISDWMSKQDVFDSWKKSDVLNAAINSLIESGSRIVGKIGSIGSVLSNNGICGIPGPDLSKVSDIGIGIGATFGAPVVAGWVGNLGAAGRDFINSENKDSLVSKEQSKLTSDSISNNKTKGTSHDRKRVENENKQTEDPIAIQTTAKVPDYAKVIPDNPEVVYHSDGSYGTICTWNDYGMTQLSCTYYTLRRLRERGLGYPCVAGPGGGGSWVSNFDTSTGLPCFNNGDNSLYDLVNSGNIPAENIVVSMSGPSSYGHVLLVDKIEQGADGKILFTYSDMWPDIGTENGSNPPKTVTIEEFYSWYHKYNGSINGAVVLGTE